MFEKDMDFWKLAKPVCHWHADKQRCFDRWRMSCVITFDKCQVNNVHVYIHKCKQGARGVTSGCFMETYI